jgi:hypothetical protein
VQELLGHATISVTLDTYSTRVAEHGKSHRYGGCVFLVGCSKSGPGLLRGPLLAHCYSRDLPVNKGKAERVGFEPTRRLNTAYAISSRAPSANSDTSPTDAGRVYQIFTATGLDRPIVPSLRGDMLPIIAEIRRRTDPSSSRLALALCSDLLEENRSRRPPA